MKERPEDRQSQAGEQGRRVLDNARDAADRARSSAQRSVSRLSHRASDVASDLAADARVQLERFTGRDVDAWTTDLRRFVQERPLQAILVTAAVGYVLGKILKR